MPIALAPKPHRQAIRTPIKPARQAGTREDHVEPPEVEEALPAGHRGNPGEPRLYIRPSVKRIAVEELLIRARHLPPASRSIIANYFELRMTIDELAGIHRLPPTQMRRRLKRLRRRLADPSFLLTAEFADQLPADLALLARQHWIECRTLRELAAELETTLHHIRTELAKARLLLIVAMAAQQNISPERARNLLK
jgi:DNA-directed RNA polymerase specialized sigma24 family protein